MLSRFASAVAVSLVVLMSTPSEGMGDPSLSLFFSQPLIAGQYGGLGWQLVGFDCPRHSLLYSGRTDWNDGSPLGQWSSEDYSGLSHAYTSPGRYHITVTFNYEWYPRDGACEPAFGTLTAETWVEVLPNDQEQQNGWLGTFFDTQATICAQPVVPGVTRVFVVAGLSGLSKSGMSGAEFRLIGWDHNAFHFGASPLPGWIMFGDPFGAGCVIAPGDCKTEARVAMLEMTAFAIDGAVDGHVIVELGYAFPNPVPGPALILCDAPVYTKIAVGHGYASLLNPSDGTITPCPTYVVSIQERTWSKVKELYR